MVWCNGTEECTYWLKKEVVSGLIDSYQTCGDPVGSMTRPAQRGAPSVGRAGFCKRSQGPRSLIRLRTILIWASLPPTFFFLPGAQWTDASHAADAVN